MKRKKPPPLTPEEQRAKILLSRDDLRLFGINYSKATLWRKVKAETFPPPVKLSSQRFAWTRESILKYIEHLERERDAAAA
jgi:predicted DNA-binding transcriptional regulator AlpA